MPRRSNPARTRTAEEERHETDRLLLVSALCLTACDDGRRGPDLARQSRCGRSFRSRQAASRISSRASCSSSCRRSSASQSWWRTGPAAGRPSVQAPSRRPNRTVIRCWRTRRRTSIAPSLNPNLSYDAARDFAAVIPLGIMPSVLVVSPAKGHKTLADFVRGREGKARCDELRLGRRRDGHASQRQRFQKSAGMQAVHVPFKGGPEALTEVMSGRVDFFFAPVGVALPHIREGKLAALAVNGAEALLVLPDVPTTGEAGWSTPNIRSGLASFFRRRRRATSSRSSTAKRARRWEPEGEGRLAALGVDPDGADPAAFEAQIVKEIAANAALVKSDRD